MALRKSTAVDAISYDGSQLAVEFRIGAGLHTAAVQGGVNLTSVIELTLTGGGFTSIIEPKGDPLFQLKAIGPAVEGRLSFLTSIPWDGTDGSGNKLGSPVIADYNATVVHSLPSGREVVIGTATTGSLTVR